MLSKDYLEAKSLFTSGDMSEGEQILYARVLNGLSYQTSHKCDRDYDLPPQYHECIYHERCVCWCHLSKEERDDLNNKPT